MAQNTAAELMLQAQASAAWEGRWRFAWDMNGDGVQSISDTWLILKWLFFAPGDWFLLMIMQHAPNIGVFFEMTPAESIYGFASGVWSAIGWFLIAGIISSPFQKYQEWKNG